MWKTLKSIMIRSIKEPPTLKERTKLIEDQKQKLLNDIEEKKAQLVHLDNKLERYYHGENY
ncbi:hypothetical protein Q0F98_34455 [Paenibacillus amylolyticus]|nr:hypothetical protein Q0F98_34455 [Paenibacillus amylolyticus]